MGLVVTSEGTARRNAMTVSQFSEVAHYPTTLWVSIAPSTLTHQLIEATGLFTLAVLHQGQGDLALACGTKSGRDADKCASMPLYQARDGAWYVGGAIASISCRVRQHLTLDDHTLFIADILRGERDSKSLDRRHLLTTDLLRRIP